MQIFKPEGQTILTPSNRAALSSPNALHEACITNETLEARALLCDKEHNLRVDLGCMYGIIPHNEGALGIDDGSVRDIALISRVNKPVMFKIIGFQKDDNDREYAILSRKAVQRECMDNYISRLCPGDVITAKVTHMENFGVFLDIGAGINGLLPIDSISVSRIPHPSVRFSVGQTIRVVVKSIDEQGRITFSHKELLGTWEQNADEFAPGETEYSAGISAGCHAGVYIKSMLPERMKIKLIIVDAFEAEYPTPPIKYFTELDHIDKWVYSPAECSKIIESDFS